MSILNRKLNLVETAAVITYFGYLLYYIGRRYIEGYYEALGIPSSLVQFSFQDYVYEGANPLQLIMAAAFVFLVVGLIRFYRLEVVQSGTHEERISFWRKLWNASRTLWNILKNRSKRENIVTIGFFLFEFAAMLPAFFNLVYLWVFIPSELTKYDLAATSILMLWVGVAMVTFVLWFDSDKVVLSLIRKYKFLSWYFSVLIVIMLIFLPHVGAYSWGITTGARNVAPGNISSNFNRIEINSSGPINSELDWERAESGLYYTKSQQYLMFESNDFLFVKPQNDVLKTISIPKSQIISFTLTK